MRVVVPRETREGETRVSLVPELVARLGALGHQVVVEPGAGHGAQIADEEYADAGAFLESDPFSTADLVVSVQPLDPGVVRLLPRGSATVSLMPVGAESPYLSLIADLRDVGVTSFAMELIPRISRAQSMDALSSQSLVSGYRCAIVAAGLLRRFFPLNMTAAGTVPPAEVLVLGAGVAGLQAIATAKRLGAVVRAYDVRPSSAEEIASVGAKPIDLGLEALDGTGGYAREMTEDRAERQRELLAPYVAAADALITTAAVPGRRAPLLVTAEMVAAMKPGSVVVDLAAESGGNVEGAQPGEVVRIGNAQVWGGQERAGPDARTGISPLLPERREPHRAADPPGRRRRGVAARLRRRDRGRRLCDSRRRDPSRGDPAGARREPCMSSDITWLTFFVLSVFVGIEVISKVSSTLHTPLMSGANAIHGVILLGAVLVAGEADGFALAIALLAIVLAAVNMVGGFLVTDRMLQMFTRKPSRTAHPKAER